MTTTTLIPEGDSATIDSACVVTTADSLSSTLDLLFPHSLEKYLLLGTLGRGGQSVVYQVADAQTARMYAFKLQHPKTPASDYLFGQECQTLAALARTFTPHPYDFGKHNDLHYIVMEFVPGKNLATRALPENKRERIESGIEILAGIAERTEPIHAAGYVHGDLKRGNVILGCTGPRIIDLGMACKIGTAADNIFPDQPGIFFGTPSFMAPEQVRDGVMLPQTDIYAFGLLAHEVLLGRAMRKPARNAVEMLRAISDGDSRCGYERPSPSELPFALVELIETCTMPKQEHRYNNMAEIIGQLKRA